MTTKEHYEKHLANFYSWMLGDFKSATENFKTYCQAHAVEPGENGCAIDLGAGNGIQTLALAELGYKVKAVDFSRRLLEELKARINGLPIEIIQDDIQNLPSIADKEVELLACCGDTLSHLESFEQLNVFLKACYDALEMGGKLLLSFRDYTNALIGTDRFIPVKKDENRILTCVLEYREDFISVTDLLYEKQDGNWVQKVSSYDKLRLRANEIKRRLVELGFSVVSSDNIKGMVHLLLLK